MLNPLAAGDDWRVVVLGDARRPTREIKLAGPSFAALLSLLIALPLGSGALLARHASAQHIVPSLRILDFDDGARAQPSLRRAPYVVLARSAWPQLPIVYEPPPAPPEPLLDREAKTPAERRGHLRMASMHHAESIDVVPFDENGEPDEAAFAAIAYFFRCRVTDHEIAVDEHLVRLLVTLNDFYDKPLHLISGHRMPHTLETSETSQHTMGTAADVRVPGVSIDELRAVALQLGARGVGLYTQKQFVHIDFRVQRKYQWTDMSEEHDAENGAVLASIGGS